MSIIFNRVSKDLWISNAIGPTGEFISETIGADNSWYASAYIDYYGQGYEFLGAYNL